MLKRGVSWGDGKDPYSFKVSLFGYVFLILAENHVALWQEVAEYDAWIGDNNGECLDGRTLLVFGDVYWDETDPDKQVDDHAEYYVASFIVAMRHLPAFEGRDKTYEG